MITRHSIVIDSQNLSYIDTGQTDKPVVVLVHGVGASSRYLLPLAMKLQVDYRVLGLDFPGFGRSNDETSSTDIVDYVSIHHAFLQKLSVRPLALIGNSFGAQIIVEQIAGHPNDALSVVLLGPSINKNERNLPMQILRFMQDAVVEPKGADTKLVLKDYRDAGVKNIARSLRAAIGHSIEASIENLHLPVLIVRGENDPIVPDDWVKELQRRAPQARLVTLKEAAHVTNLHNPDQAVIAIREFLQTLV